MMKKQKKPYEKPCMQHFLVEAEDPICSGSVDMTAGSPYGGADTPEQTVNTGFNSENNFGSGSWDDNTTTN